MEYNNSVKNHISNTHYISHLVMKNITIYGISDLTEEWSQQYGVIPHDLEEGFIQALQRVADEDCVRISAPQFKCYLKKRSSNKMLPFIRSENTIVKALINKKPGYLPPRKYYICISE